MHSMPNNEVNQKENTVGKIAMVTDSKGCYLERSVGSNFYTVQFLCDGI